MKIAERTLQYIEKLGGTEAAAKFFNVPQKRLQSWINLGRFPNVIYDQLDDALPETVAATAPVIATSEPELAEQPAMDYQVPVPVYEPEPEVIGVPDNDARIMDLHYRVSDLEQKLEQLGMQMVTERPSKVPQEASLTRPGGGYRGATQPARENNGYNVAPGRAPTREQAHWSAQGQRGKLAGPAAPRQRPLDAPGNYDWNKPRQLTRSVK